MKYAVPVLLLLSVLIAAVKKISVYDSFAEGAKEAVRLTVSLLPYLITVFILLELLTKSGLDKKISDFSAPLFSIFGIPKELIPLILLRPLSGSGSLALTETLFKTYGADSYIGRCASVISAGSDTVLYIVAVYLSQSDNKKSGAAIPVALLSAFLGNILACLLCKYI